MFLLRFIISRSIVIFPARVERFLGRKSGVWGAFNGEYSSATIGYNSPNPFSKQEIERMTVAAPAKNEFTVSSRLGKVTFVSNHPNKPALFGRLKELTSSGRVSGPHALRLVDGYERFGGWKRSHETWAAFYVAKHDHPDRFQAGNRGSVRQGFQAITDHVANAAKFLQRPSITLEAGGVTVCLRWTRKKSLSVSDSPSFGGIFYGYINGDEWDCRRNYDVKVEALLRRVAVDPSRVISEIGRASGKCCYCPARLTQVQSKIAGCGKVCARNYGVRWPDAAETRSVLLDAPEFLEGASDADRWSVS